MLSEGKLWYYAWHVKAEVQCCVQVQFINVLMICVFVLDFVKSTSKMRYTCMLMKKLIL